MKKDFIFGTTSPITPSEGSYAGSKEGQERCLTLMKEAHIKLERTFFWFPFKDESMTETTDDYKRTLELIKLYKENGIDTMAGISSAETSAVDSLGLVSFVRNFPSWTGNYDEDRFYENVEKTGAKIAEDLKDLVTYWQIGNENDNVAFKGTMTHEQNVRYLKALARGVKKGNPKAICGHNLCGVPGNDGGLVEVSHVGPFLHSVHPYAEQLLNDLYHGDEELFDYIGLDGYFGSWADGAPEDWIPYIDRAHEVTGKPVIINEWGYSTLQRGKPRPEADRNRRFNQNVCRYKDWDYNGTRKWKDQDHTPELQAEFITECMKIFLNHPYCIGELFFQWQDQAHCWQCGDDDCPSETAWGCIDKYGNPKPGYEALKKFTLENE